MSDDLEQKVAHVVLKRCIHQVFRPQGYHRAQGQGDCRICEYDPAENARCTRYNQILVSYIMRIDSETPS